MTVQILTFQKLTCGERRQSSSRPFQRLTSVPSLLGAHRLAYALIVRIDRNEHGQASIAYSHDGPIGRRMCGCILTTDQSDSGCAAVYSHDGQIGRRTHLRMRERRIPA
eukprot:1194209-Prorocentrum_minimum.AAC.4